MFRRLTIVALLFSAAFASAKYEEFKHPHPNNNGLYIWVEGPPALLGLNVPTNVVNCWNVEIDELGNAITNGTKTVLEYLAMPPIYSVDSNSVIILLNEKHDPRITGVNDANIANWDISLSPYGLGFDAGAWMGLDGSACANKLSARLASPAFYRGDEF